jgi:hypothetical protein
MKLDQNGLPYYEHGIFSSEYIKISLEDWKRILALRSAAAELLPYEEGLMDLYRLRIMRRRVSDLKQALSNFELDKTAIEAYLAALDTSREKQERTNKTLIGQPVTWREETGYIVIGISEDRRLRIKDANEQILDNVPYKEVKFHTVGPKRFDVWDAELPKVEVFLKDSKSGLLTWEFLIESEMV